jgi:hypothetical protein
VCVRSNPKSQQRRPSEPPKHEGGGRIKQGVRDEPKEQRRAAGRGSVLARPANLSTGGDEPGAGAGGGGSPDALPVTVGSLARGLTPYINDRTVRQLNPAHRMYGGEEARRAWHVTHAAAAIKVGLACVRVTVEATIPDL